MFILVKIVESSREVKFLLILYAPAPQNGQTHANNFLSVFKRIVFDHFGGLALKRLILY